MWPIEQLRQRKYQRRFDAALIVFLGEYMALSLEPTQQQRVEREMNDNFNRSDTTAAAWRGVLSWEVVAAFRAAAMQRAGIEPRVGGLTWAHLFRHWRQRPIGWPLGTGFDQRSVHVANDFRPMDAATNDAKVFLRRGGLNVPDADPRPKERKVAV